jgi:hypothetical protein
LSQNLRMWYTRRMEQPRPSTPFVIGFTSLTRAAWLPELIAHLAHLWASMGHDVVMVDGDPWGAAPEGWVADEPGDRTMSELLDGAILGADTAPANVALSAALGEEVPSGALGVMFGRGEAKPPEAPTARSVLFARRALQNALVGMTRADVVLVRLPPLCEPVGQALGANLIDVLVPCLGPLDLPQAAPLLAQSAAMQATNILTLPVELSANPVDESLWRAILGQPPAAQLRVGRGGDELQTLVGELSDLLRPRVRLAHPDPMEAILEADALEHGEGAYEGFRRLIQRDEEEAMRFFRDTLAGRSATLRSAAEALRAMDDAGLGLGRLAYGLRYVVQKFRVAEPDPLSEYVQQLGERLLAAAREAPVPRLTRLKIDVAFAMMNHAFYLRAIERHDLDLAQAANRLLLEATEEVEVSKEAGDCLRLAEGFARHGALCNDNRNAELALNLVALSEQRGTETLIVRQRAIDVLWLFCGAAPTKPLLRLMMRLANDLMPLDPGYAHYALIGAWDIAGDKMRATEHLRQLGIVDEKRFKMALEDSWLEHFFLGVATSRFYKSVPMMGLDPFER